MAKAQDRYNLRSLFARTEPAEEARPEEDERTASADETQPVRNKRLASTDVMGEAVPAAGQPARRRGRPLGKGGRTVAVGVGLKEAELAELDALAARLQITRNALLGFAVRYFLRQQRTGQVTVQMDEADDL